MNHSRWRSYTHILVLESEMYGSNHPATGLRSCRSDIYYHVWTPRRIHFHPGIPNYTDIAGLTQHLMDDLINRYYAIHTYVFLHSEIKKKISIKGTFNIIDYDL